MKPFEVINDNIGTIRQLCESLPYRTAGMKVDGRISVIDTAFFIDRDKHESLDSVYIDRLGELPDGYEWLAFTFQTQKMILDRERLSELLDFSAEQLNDAYSRMNMWAKGTVREADTLERLLDLKPGCSVLDVGCGQGRHSVELASRGYEVLGLDASREHVRIAKTKSTTAEFKLWDARKRLPGKAFDNVICLYDVIGSYRTLEENESIVRSLSQKLRKGGRAAISVMNMEHVRLRAKHRGDVQSDPGLLLPLKASNTMQTTGDDLLLDEKAHLVYHKEQFEEDGQLSAEYVVADYRFTRDELAAVLERHGLKVLDSRFVRAGKFEEPLAENDDGAKKILFIAEKI